MRRRSPAAPPSLSFRSPRPRRAARWPRRPRHTPRWSCGPQPVPPCRWRCSARGPPAPCSPHPRHRERSGRRLRLADGRGRARAPARGAAWTGPGLHVRRESLWRSAAPRHVERATGRLLAYVCDARGLAGVHAMTAFPTVELTVYPYDCDAFGHLNQAALLTLLERARWEALARGPGMDLFDRNGVWPAARKAVIEYKAGASPRDVLRIETTVVHRGTTSLTLRHVVRRVADDALIAEAEIVFVCVDRLGRATPLPEEIARLLRPPTSGSHQPIRVTVGAAELGVEVRGDGPPILLVHGFPFDRTMWRHQLAALPRWQRIAPDLRC